MKILVAHNAYQISGGEDVVVAQETDLLRRMGHRVVEYRRSNHELSHNKLSALASLKVTLWATEAYRDVEQIILQHKPDVAHFHNTFMMISPAAYYACRRNGVPVVQTLHNYRLLCPRADLYRNHSICELCVGRTPWPGILHACYRGSRLQTAAVATMLTLHRVLGSWREQVDVFITPTEFARNKAMEAGVPADKVVVKPHFLSRDPGEGLRKGNYALFVGRLSREKGLHTLLRAWSSLKGWKLKLVGPGEDDPDLRELLRLGNPSDVEVLGQCSREQVFAQMKEAFLLIFPSVLYETFGMSMIEAFACGVPVVASRLGAMAELVGDRQTGLLFEPGNSADLGEKLSWAFAHPDDMARMGTVARAAYLKCYTARSNSSMLEAVYQKALSSFRDGANSPGRNCNHAKDGESHSSEKTGIYPDLEASAKAAVLP